MGSSRPLPRRRKSAACKYCGQVEPHVAALVEHLEREHADLLPSDD